ncbi:hypothetical protein CERZMDRAFT_122414 [Cercospora zeae-maydis SCOH1-5]|uniref:Heterokaryon incompatibility domain-containing protein n=1 Tax=Cercospora zeae-maydis SCOH1-5 TaxID=717836 RepID=A0A6A6F479_9PEZI|nr:hypothetical protein CERZMDRAFT_122414 [Cercospora zeae-maydis SCOH1-5]
MGAELTEAINSMYTYYRKARICYVYLSEITDAGALADARWWTRGWTLQELLAPTHAVFYMLDWQYIGARAAMADAISSITGIQRQYLVHRADEVAQTMDETSSIAGMQRPHLKDSAREVVKTASIAKRMSWAAKRKTSRSEDMPHSLLGLFSVNMPLLYGGGGQRAFLRLQEEIMKSQIAWREGSLEVFELRQDDE